MAVKIAFDKKLEGLRGLCAVTVALTHVLIYEFFCTGGISLKFISSYFGFAHEAVLIFFIISGYVIGAQHIRTPINYHNTLSYLKKRAIRLYPVYLLAILLSFLIRLPAYFPPAQLIGHLFFTQGVLVNTVSSNVVLWSLSYEVVYYLLFCGLWASGKYNTYLCVCLSMTIAVYAVVMPNMTIFISIFTGWIFWMAGLWLSQQPMAIKALKKRFYKPFFSYFAIVLSIHNLDIRENVVRLLHHQPDTAFKLGAGDLVLLPICLVIVLEVTDSGTIFINHIKAVAYLIPTGYIAILFYFHHPVMTNMYKEFGIMFFLIALIVYPLRLNTALFGKLNYLGGISYALYIFHFPVAVFLNIYLSRVLTGIPLYVTGFFSWAVLTVGLSILAEKILQPYIKTAILKPALI